MLNFDSFWRENSNSNINQCIIIRKNSFIFGTKIQIHNFFYFSESEFLDTISDFLIVCKCGGFSSRLKKLTDLHFDDEAHDTHLSNLTIFNFSAFVMHNYFYFLCFSTWTLRPISWLKRTPIAHQMDP